MKPIYPEKQTITRQSKYEQAQRAMRRYQARCHRREKEAAEKAERAKQKRQALFSLKEN